MALRCVPPPFPPLQIVVHRQHGYRGVVCGWDAKGRAPDGWFHKMSVTDEVILPVDVFLAAQLFRGLSPLSHTPRALAS